ncbi:DUF2794 domain-containing protein [Roseiarcaceae bacterium H3SJ34-1]|uniref:DUF2794 domain-containing protein n=1 Tax=Terripilifer ovatus TaxID=3032367 RepID=UPI003AB9959D|nr:DUF2794 domain-containing protein [Roseiarcaceae bacterium H3SJ34-1]
MTDSSEFDAGREMVQQLHPAKKPRSPAAEVPQTFGHRPDIPAVVSFNRHELREIMNLYGRMVAAGEWRDYAIDFMPDKAVFSIFRRTSEMPLYRIEKDPKLANKQGAYSVLTPTGLILKRGQELARVLAVIDKKLKVVSG